MAIGKGGKVIGKDRSYTVPIFIASVVLLSIVAFLYLGPKIFSTGLQKGTLPRINAFVNGSTALVLIAAFIAIRRKKIALHKRLMLLAVALSAIFLVLYVIQHGSFPSTSYDGEQSNLYFFILITHIILAAAIVPLVLITLVRALSQRFDKHRKIARITLPLWLYVSITGVIVYLMIAPYY